MLIRCIQNQNQSFWSLLFVIQNQTPVFVLLSMLEYFKLSQGFWKLALATDEVDLGDTAANSEKHLNEFPGSFALDARFEALLDDSIITYDFAESTSRKCSAFLDIEDIEAASALRLKKNLANKNFG